MKWVTTLEKEAKDATIKVVNIGQNKIRYLFTASLSSKTPLSDVIFERKGKASSEKIEYEIGISKAKDKDRELKMESECEE